MDQLQIWSICSETAEKTFFKTGHFSQVLVLSLKTKTLMSHKSDSPLRIAIVVQTVNSIVEQIRPDEPSYIGNQTIFATKNF